MLENAGKIVVTVVRSSGEGSLQVAANESDWCGGAAALVVSVV